MNPWFHRLLLILTIGGGFTGIAFTAALFSQASNVFGYLILLGFIVLHGWGVLLGVRLSEGKPSVTGLRGYFGFQVPFISSPIYLYQFCPGFHVTAAVIGSKFNVGFRLGADMQFGFLKPAPWGFGINLFALAMLILLYSRFAEQPPDEET